MALLAGSLIALEGASSSEKSRSKSRSTADAAGAAGGVTVGGRDVVLAKPPPDFVSCSGAGPETEGGAPPVW